MNCIGPATPEDFELLAYADGAAAPWVTTHLLACPRCQLRSGELRLEQLTWQRALHRSGCPQGLELGEYHVGFLPPDRAAHVSEHVKYCRACASELAMFAAFLRRTEDNRAGEALTAAGARLRTIIARLSNFGLDISAGRVAPLPRAVRESRGPYLEGAPVPITYSAEDILVAIEFWPESGAATRQIAGLVAGAASFAGAEVELWNGDAAPRTAGVDELGSFLLPGVAVGPHRLLVKLPASGVQVQIEDLAVS